MLSCTWFLWWSLKECLPLSSITRCNCNIDVFQAYVTDVLDGEITVALDNRLSVHSVPEFIYL